MMQIQPETGESLVLILKRLIQLYLLRLFIYSLTYCIKEVINCKIFWRLNEKKSVYEAATDRNMGISHSIIVTALIQLYLKVFTYDAATTRNRLIPCNIL